MKGEINHTLSALKAAGERGLFIDELATSLGIDKEGVAEAIQQLESKGLVRVQKQQLEEEQYIIKAVFSEDDDSGRLSDMNGCPCFHCLRIAKCGVRQLDSPVTC
ncbi:MAG: GntR family transcriptional regulator, partial [Candidatus Thorarchaeota archaeon]|nr:GntR family transcriptional regulator [Candidatus Thorarchaeota archaeon]